MVLLSGKVSRFFISLIYIGISILLFISKKIKHHYIQLYQAKAFFDCGVDNDINENTCVSAYTVQRSVKVPLNMVFQAAFIFAAIFNLLILMVHSQHDISIFRYLDNILVNTTTLFIICIVGGIQEVKLLIVISSSILCLEILYAYHDYNLDTSMTTKLAIIMWITQVVIWCTIIFSNITYLMNADGIPIWIPCMVYSGLMFMFLVRFFHIRFYYHIVPSKIGYEITDTYETIKSSYPYYIDWLESWSNILYVIQRCSMVLFYYLLPSNFEINYI
jgi:hypothetical protein